DAVVRWSTTSSTWNAERRTSYHQRLLEPGDECRPTEPRGDTTWRKPVLTLAPGSIVHAVADGLRRQLETCGYLGDSQVLVGHRGGIPVALIASDILRASGSSSAASDSRRSRSASVSCLYNVRQSVAVPSASSDAASVTSTSTSDFR